MITLALIAALAAQGVSVTFDSHHNFVGDEPITQVWSASEDKAYPCESLAQPEAQFTYCKVGDGYVVFVKQP